MTKIGIIRCNSYSKKCAGFSCFPAIQNKTGKFQPYDEIELVGFDTCGGCDRGKADQIVGNAQRLKEKGAEVIHLGGCLTGGCPVGEVYVNAIKNKVDIDVVKGTH